MKLGADSLLPISKNGHFMTNDTTKLSEVKRALLEKHLRGELLQTLSPISASSQEHPIQSDKTTMDDQIPSVVPIQTGGFKRPLFYLHVHVTGGAFYNFALADALGPDQPFYMLDPSTFDSKKLPPTLEAMAAAYIKALRSVQLEGPYQLVGFCGGGIIAFEMAQQLQAQGQTVEPLVLIEPRDGPAPHRLFARKLFVSLIRRIGTLLGANAEKQLEWFLYIRYIVLHLLKSQYRTDQHFSRTQTYEMLRKDWIGVFVWIIAQYNTRRFPGKVTYFWAREEPKYLRTWWGKIAEAKELAIHLIPGTHDTCRTDYLKDMAEHLRHCLDEVQTTRTEPRIGQGDYI